MFYPLRKGLKKNEMARAEHFNKVIKREKAGYSERMKLSLCVNFPQASASSSKASVFPRGGPGPFYLT